MPIPEWISRSLDAQRLPYRVHHHRTAYTAEAVARREHVSGLQLGKVVVVLADGKPAILVMPEYARIEPELARLALSASELRLASEDEIAQLLPGSEVGATPPLRHWPGVEIWMDSSLAHDGEIVFAAGTHQDAIHMAFADWVRAAQPKTGEFVAQTFVGA
jgi:Ala-tRNA(Pro) deacylase